MIIFRRVHVCALILGLIGVIALVALVSGALASAAFASAAGAQPVDGQPPLPSVLSPWLGLFAMAISLGGTIYAWMTSRSKVNAEHLRSVDVELAEHGRAIQAIEGELKHIPAKDDVTELKIAMAEIKGSVAVFNEGMGTLSRTVRRIEEFLMKEGK
ncbi:MAG: DUF2730 family protein [Rhizobiaceae bacterium]|nr:DUF2730 family protein [Rhizobiaceae bacterium]